MQILSSASKKFLAPVEKDRLRGAVLRLSLPDKLEAALESDVTSDSSKESTELPKNFLIEVFNRTTDTEGNIVETPPESFHASRFIERRFKHGYRKASSKGTYHPRYYVPATDYTLYLFLHTWTGEREISPSARPLLEQMIAHESSFAKISERTAIYKDRLHDLLDGTHDLSATCKHIDTNCTCEACSFYVRKDDVPMHILREKNTQSTYAFSQMHTFVFSESSDEQIEREYGPSGWPKDAMIRTKKKCTVCEQHGKKDPEYFMRKDNDFLSSLTLSSFLAQKGTHNPDVPDMTIYQKVCATNLIETPDNSGYALYKEPGCGKTYPSIGLIDYVTATTHAIHNRPARILVLVPKNIRGNWVNEINFFSRFDLQTSILQGQNSTVRMYKLIESLVTKKKGAVVIAGYETAAATANPILSCEWDLVIIDESHSIANASTKRSKFAIKLRDRAKKRVVLTGTPIRNTPFDLYAQFEFLNRGGSGLASFNAFKNFFGEWKNIPGKGIRILEELKNIPLLQERLAKYCFLLTKKEAMPSMPPQTFDIMECALNPEQAQVYKQVATHLAAQLTDTMDAMTVRSHLTKLLRLAEITSGYAKTDESGIHRFDPNPKLEMVVEEVKEYLSNNPDSKVQIWCHFRENIKQLRARFNDVEKIPAVVFYGGTKDSERAEAERRFNCDLDTKIFIGSPTAGGVGLNLLGFDPRNPDAYETNCDWVIYYSQNWSSTARRQSKDRAYRKGTRVPIRVTDAIVPGSIDKMILDRVNAKINMAESVQDIRSILDAVLNPEVSM